MRSILLKFCTAGTSQDYQFTAEDDFVLGRKFEGGKTRNMWGSAPQMD